MGRELTPNAQSKPLGAYVCPNCGAAVAKDDIECRSCKADLGAPSGWRPLPRDHLERHEPALLRQPTPPPRAQPALRVKVGWTVVCSLSLLAAFLGYLIFLVTWGSRELRGTGASVLFVLFRFQPGELLPFVLPAAVLLKIFLGAARLPNWFPELFLLAAASLSLFLLAMHFFGIYGWWAAPFLLAPSLVLYVLGGVLVCCALARRSESSPPPTTA
jgi:hypothetical protein